ncbi:MAG: ribosomal L7Ae/L30e/S12e/Gadd45 family protein [Candidatus Woesearchaeota archaeon]
MVGTELSKESVEKVYEMIEIAKASGKIRKGTNEVTKALERGQAKLVAIANDVSPAEIVMHLPILAKEKNIVAVQVGSKAELGAAASLDVGTTTVAIIDEGDAKEQLKKVLASLKE